MRYEHEKKGVMCVLPVAFPSVACTVLFPHRALMLMRCCEGAMQQVREPAQRIFVFCVPTQPPRALRFIIMSCPCAQDAVQERASAK